jgi:hypothetical protein
VYHVCGGPIYITNDYRRLFGDEQSKGTPSRNYRRSVRILAFAVQFGIRVVQAAHPFFSSDLRISGSQDLGRFSMARKQDWKQAVLRNKGRKLRV